MLPLPFYCQSSSKSATRKTLPFLLLLIHLSLCRGQATDDAGDTTTTTTTRHPGPVSATFETLEVCTQRCECPCRDTTVTMEDGREFNMFYCARPKVVQGTSVMSSLFSTIVSSPFLLALSLILIVVLIAFTLASSVFGCCMCCRRRPSKADPSEKAERGKLGA